MNNLFESTTFIFGSIDVICVVLLVGMVIVGRRRPRGIDGTYFRDIPKSTNPVQDAVIALSYRNPKAKTLEKVLSEKNLVAYVFLDCLDKRKIKYVDSSIEIKWNELSEAEKLVFEKISLVNIGRAILGDEWVSDCPFVKVNDHNAIIYLDRVEKYGQKLESNLKIERERVIFFS